MNIPLQEACYVGLCTMYYYDIHPSSKNISLFILFFFPSPQFPTATVLSLQDVMRLWRHGMRELVRQNKHNTLTAVVVLSRRSSTVRSD